MISKTKYNWLDMPLNAKSFIVKLSDKGHSSPIDLMGPVRLFGKDQRYISVSPNWMINLLQDDRGNIEYRGRPKQLPDAVVDPDDGYMLIPFGEQMYIRTCGTMAKVWVLSDRSVVSVITKNAFTKKLIIFQLHFLYGSEVVEVHYWKAMTGHSTIIGACGKPEEYLEWGCNVYEELGKTAIRIDTTHTASTKPITIIPDPVVIAPDPVIPPSVMQTVTVSGYDLKVNSLKGGRPF